jgi:hypothetical protein
MKLAHWVPRAAGFATAVAVTFTAITMKAQTVISNETLVTTTFVVNKTDATAKCGKSGCRASAPILKSIGVTCPAAIGETCTFHIAFDAKVSLTYPNPQGGSPGLSPTASYQFLVDGLAPSVGPTDGQGGYLFARNVLTEPEYANASSRQSFGASVIATVKNTSSNNHSIDVNIRCHDASGVDGDEGCEATAHWSTMRVDVFEP